MIHMARTRSDMFHHHRVAIRRNSDVNIEKWGRSFVVLTILSWSISVVGGLEIGLTVLTLLGFFAAIYGLRKPALGILGIGLLCTLDTVTRGYLLTGGILRWNTFNYWLIIVIALNFSKLFRSEYWPMRILLLFVTVLGLQLLQSSDVDGGTQHLLNVIACLGLVAYFSRVQMTPEIWKWFGLISGLVAAMGAGVFFIKGAATAADTISNPNSFVYFPLTALFSICLAYRHLEGQKRIQFAMLALAMINAGWAFLTTSRSGVGIAVCCLVFLILQMRNLSNYVSVALIALVLGLGSTQFSQFEQNTLSRFDKLFDEDRGLANRTSGRSDLFAGGWEIFLSSPLIGVGTGSFSDKWAEMTAGKNISYRAGRKSDAHSAWIKVLVENGIVGITIFVTFILSILVRGWNRRRLGVQLLGLWVTVVLVLAFVTTEFQTKGVWMLIAGALAVMHGGYPDRAMVSRAAPIRRTGLRNYRKRVNA